VAIAFDAATKRIVLDSASTSATEIFSRWEDWALLSDNLKYGMVIRQVGSDDLGGGLSIPPYFFLQGDWRVRPMESDHNLTITGNLFVEGGGVPVVRTLGDYQVNVNYTVPVQAQGISTSGSTGPSAGEIADAVRAALASELSMIEFANKVLKNTKDMTNGLKVFDDDDVTVILDKALLDKDDGPIAALASGVVVKERKSTV
jgi:hypothetical protein